MRERRLPALDRQHPRDFFDWRDLLANEGINDALRRAFLVYMLSHDRPMSEVLAPTRKDITDDFARDFDGMTEQPVTLDELVAAREALIAGMVGDMPDAHRSFCCRSNAASPTGRLSACSCGRLAGRQMAASQSQQACIRRARCVGCRA